MVEKDRFSHRAEPGSVITWEIPVTKVFALGVAMITLLAAPCSALENGPPAQAVQPSEASVKEAFEAAKELGTLEAWDAFLANYPTGFRADLARAYIKKLDAGGAVRAPLGKPPQPNADGKGEPSKGDPGKSESSKSADDTRADDASAASAPAPTPKTPAKSIDARPPPATKATAKQAPKASSAPENRGVDPTDPGKPAVARGGRFMGFPEAFNRYYTEPSWAPEKTVFVSPTGKGDGANRETPMGPSGVIAAAQPGTRIVFLPGAYQGGFEFPKEASGTYDAPVVLYGERKPGGAIGVTMSCAKGSRQACLNFEGASYVAVDGFEFVGGKFGVRAIGEGYAASGHSRGIAVLNSIGHDQDRDPFFSGAADWAVWERLVAYGAGKGDGHGMYLSNAGDWNVVRFNETYGNLSSDFQINPDPASTCQEPGIPFNDPRCDAYAGEGEGGQGASDYFLVDGNYFHHGAAQGANFISVRRSVIRNNVFGLHAEKHNATFYQETDNPKLGTSDNTIVHNLFVTSTRRHAVKFENNSTRNLFANNLIMGVTVAGGTVKANPSALLMEVDGTDKANTYRSNLYVGGTFEGREPGPEETRREDFSPAWFAKFPTALNHDANAFAPAAGAPFLAMGARSSDAPTDRNGTARTEKAALGPIEGGSKGAAAPPSRSAPNREKPPGPSVAPEAETADVAPETPPEPEPPPKAAPPAPARPVKPAPPPTPSASPEGEPTAEEPAPAPLPKAPSSGKTAPPSPVKPAPKPSPDGAQAPSNIPRAVTVARATTIPACTAFVDAAAKAGGTGTAQKPHKAIAVAIATAREGAVICVAEGVYPEQLKAGEKGFTLAGGFQSGTEFKVRDSAAHVSKATGRGGSFLRIDDPGPKGKQLTAIDGFDIGGYSQGIVRDYYEPQRFDITNNHIHDNVCADQTLVGGGFALNNVSGAIKGNVIRNNACGRGGAGFTNDTTNTNTVTVENNLVDGNAGTEPDSAHGGALYLFGNTLRITGNLITNNSVTQWGGGLYVGAYTEGNQPTTATIAWNVYRGNRAGDSGGGFFCDDGAKCLVSHEIYDRNCGGNILVDGGAAGSGPTISTFDHITNVGALTPGCDSPGIGLLIDNYEVVAPDSHRVTNSLFWGNAEGGDFAVACSKRCNEIKMNVDHSMVQTKYADGSIKIGFGAGIVSPVDPLFVSADKGNFHLQSAAGRWSPAGSVSDAATSHAIGKGDPKGATDANPERAGPRSELGAYGNSSEASYAR